VFTIKSKEDILETLKQQQDMAGIDLAELKEAYPKIEETVAVLDHILPLSSYLVGTCTGRKDFSH
jgi:hypothetical protein